jgi:hypothetical protein
LLSISSNKTLFTNNFFFPNLNKVVLVFFLSIYIHKFSSNLLFVEGGPNSTIISFLLDLLTVKLSCFLSR